jgi:hypothetical protein
MAAIHRHGEAYYLVGVAGLPDLCWRRDADRWVSAPEVHPSTAQTVTIQELPADLREELLAFVARAQAMGAGRMDSGN